MTNKLLINS